MTSISGAGRAAAIVAVVVVALTAPGASTAVDHVGGDDFPAALLAIAHLAGLVVASWLLVVLVAESVRIPMPGVPAAVRALLFTTAVITAVAGPAHAESPRDLDGLTLPDRPMTTQTFTPAAATAAHDVTVRAGDTLWGIAARRLPRDTSPADIAASVARWHATNRAVIGGDPNLIRPGQILATPLTTAEQDLP